MMALTPSRCYVLVITLGIIVVQSTRKFTHYLTRLTTTYVPTLTEAHGKLGSSKV